MQRRLQAGVSLAGFMFVIVIVGLLAVLALKIVPTVVEFRAVQSALDNASRLDSPQAIKESFDKQRTASYIDSVSGRDLDITRTATGYEVSVAYEKRIPLVGPASLVIDYQASSGRR